MSTEGGGFFDEELPEGLICPYVSTTDVDTRRFLKLASVTSEDVVYDLGCGGGHIICLTCKEVGCRGYGVDLSELRVKEAGELASESGVSELATFVVGDLLEADTSKASILALYLLPENLEAMRELLSKRLIDGAADGGVPVRIATFEYSIPGWLAIAEDAPEGTETSIFLYDVTSLPEARAADGEGIGEVESEAAGKGTEREEKGAASS